MGLGDDVMAAGEARRMRRTDARKVQIVDRKRRPYYREIWNGCPDLARGRDSDPQVLKNGPGYRPYIDYGKSTPERWAWRQYTPEPANLGPYRKNTLAADCILIEPHLKSGASPNKQWPYWRELVKAPHKWLQIGPHGTSVLPGVKFIPTQSIWEAVAVVAACKTAVLPEGGLHHMAAATGTKAVVLFGGYISPAQTGYALHRNIFTGGEPCGWRKPCAHCNEAMRRITPAMVLDELSAILC